jgi:hypothetical protein
MAAPLLKNDEPENRSSWFFTSFQIEARDACAHELRKTSQTT